MKKVLSLLFVLLILFNCSGFASFAEENPTSVSDNMDFAVKTAEIIKNDSDMLRIIGKLQPLTSDFSFPYADSCVLSEDGRFVLQFSSENDLLSSLEKLNKNPNIIYAERDCEIYTAETEESGEYLSWGVEALEADIYSKFIAPLTSDKTITVAIIDSGIEDIDFLKDKLTQGYDFFDNDGDAFQDESPKSHGTFLASIIADCTRDLPVKIMPVRVLGSKNASLINAVNGIIYAVDNGADVINISLSTSLSNCRSLEDAIDYAEKSNVTVVVCAGNTQKDINKICPAHIDSALTVTSINSEYEFSETFSNYGKQVDFAAPGEDIAGYNALGEITSMDGTSMSTAFVSAAAAMFRLVNPTCTIDQVRDALVSCAEDYGDEGWDEYYGWGVLKLGNLIKRVEAISFAEDFYALYEGADFEINPVFSPADATDKRYTLSSNSECVSINGNVITAVSEGVAVLTVTSIDGNYSDTVEIKISKTPELKIRNNPDIKTINYGETLRLTADILYKPENASVWWYVDGVKTAEGETFEISPQSESVEVTVNLVNADGTVITDKDGNEISDSQTISVKSGFFQKLISFFKNLFGIDRTVIQVFNKASIL